MKWEVFKRLLSGEGEPYATSITFKGEKMSKRVGLEGCLLAPALLGTIGWIVKGLFTPGMQLEHILPACLTGIGLIAIALRSLGKRK